jgi:hypothetical protein
MLAATAVFGGTGLLGGSGAAAAGRPHGVTAGRPAAGPPTDIPVVLEPCLVRGGLTACWAVRPSDRGDGSLDFNLVAGAGRGQSTVYVDGIGGWRAWSRRAAQTTCRALCPRLNIYSPPGLWITVGGLRLTLSGPRRQRYATGSYLYFSRLRIYSFRQRRQVTLDWSWPQHEYLRASGGLSGLRL